eukprot:3452867-Pleurochrysis_carterae.AAC.1
MVNFLRLRDSAGQERAGTCLWRPCAPSPRRPRRHARTAHCLDSFIHKGNQPTQHDKMCRLRSCLNSDDHWMSCQRRCLAPSASQVILSFDRTKQPPSDRRRLDILRCSHVEA